MPIFLLLDLGIIDYFSYLYSMEYKVTSDITDNVMIFSITTTMTVDRGCRILSKELIRLEDEIKALTKDKVKQSKSFWDRYIVDIEYNVNGLTKGKKSKYKVICYLKPIDCGDKGLSDEVAEWYKPIIDGFKTKYNIR